MIIGLSDSNDPKHQKQTIRKMAKAAGCTCRPHIAKPKRGNDRLLHVRVSHDAWCYLLQRRHAGSN